MLKNSSQILQSIILNFKRYEIIVYFKSIEFIETYDLINSIVISIFLKRNLNYKME